MFSRVFKKSKPKNDDIASLDKLNETLVSLEKKEKVLQKKAAEETERAKEFTRVKNKRGALQCLKRKKLFEQQIEQLFNFQLRIHDQMIMIEGAKVTTGTVEALRTGAAAMKAMEKTMNIDYVDKTLDEVNEQTENIRQIQEALAAPLGSAVDFDEDELEAELDALKIDDLEEQLLQPATSTIPATPVHIPPVEQSAQTSSRTGERDKEKEEEEEVATLQTEMAL
ncbi:PREDICTED: vacuolar protein sorting-associated protein 32 homolog 2-like [Ipomoea nil]|uniref:vacuolar protein sorting-associated protein 32 homolog 2-like n=1 Tax=Ipomoea nil TaxID=35883 RepID=UPI000901FEE6|nr:PREDICTED: vacuolar protein sorting-associated protein 32 homolog 2-like [Ipomoea nil]